MDEAPKVNLLDPLTTDPKRSARRRLVRNMLIALVVSMALTLTAASGVGAPTEALGEVELPGPLAIISRVGRLVASAERPLEGEHDDRVNILLLGMGGWGHDGPLLTDTIIVLSFKPSTRQAALVSVPRDLLVEIPGYGWRKANHANALPENDEPGTGGPVAAQVLGKTLGIDIAYWLRVDFRGFVKLVDDLGGITVDVERGFTDAQYPAPDDEYRTVSFRAGTQRMDGETALIFARSRHGSNGEGSDFARSARQQKILTALKDTVLSHETLANPKKVAAVLELLRTSVATNIEPWEMLRFAEMARDFDQDALAHLVIDDGPSGLLVPANVEGAYVLVPRGNDYGQLAAAVDGIFAAAPSAAVDDGFVPAAPVRVEIQNGTRVAGLASRVSDTLTARGYAVAAVGNADKQNYERTVIFDRTGGRHPEALRELRAALGAEAAVTLPEWLSSPDVPEGISVRSPDPRATNVDFLIILGTTSVAALPAP